jgi:phosphoribosyl 1,2-cyclic phosphate phosphodiesterase
MKYLLVTHSHMDHFYAHDFILRGYKYTSENHLPLTIYGNAEVIKVFQECTRREMKDCVAPNYTLVEVKPFQAFALGKGEGYKVTPLLAQHSKEEEALVYLIDKEDKAYLHLTDTGRLPLATLDYLEKYFNEKRKKVDFVTFDCTFLNRTAGEVSRHMGLGDNRVMQEEFLRRKIADGHTRYAITHYSHNGAPLREHLEKMGEEYGYIPSFDGLCVEI